MRVHPVRGGNTGPESRLDRRGGIGWGGLSPETGGDLSQPLSTVAGLVERAFAPMALMVGTDGALIANAAMRSFLAGPLPPAAGGACEGIDPSEQGEFLSDILSIARHCELRCLRDQAIRCVRGGVAAVAWLNLDFTPVTDDNGVRIAVLCTASDVTDHVVALCKRTDAGCESAAHSEKDLQFDVLTESLPQIVWSSGPEGEHDYFSNRWSEFTGIPRDAITADTWKTLIYPDHWARVSKAWETARATGEPYDIDYRFRHHSGEYRWLRVMALPVRDDQGRITRWCGTSTDVHDAYLLSEERQRLARELERIATEDQLTEVLTRRAFLDRAAGALRMAEKARKAVSVLMMDIDHFKSINDSYGHSVGDTVLSLASKRIISAVKEKDLVGRLGGEEFAILLRECAAEEAFAIAERVRHAIAEEPFQVSGTHAIDVSISIGGTTSASSGATIERLLIAADKALYRAKSSGRNRCEFSPG